MIGGDGINDESSRTAPPPLNTLYLITYSFSDNAAAEGFFGCMKMEIRLSRTLRGAYP